MNVHDNIVVFNKKKKELENNWLMTIVKMRMHLLHSASLCSLNVHDNVVVFNVFNVLSTSKIVMFLNRTDQKAYHLENGKILCTPHQI